MIKLPGHEPYFPCCKECHWSLLEGRWCDFLCALGGKYGYPPCWGVKQVAKYWGWKDENEI